MRSIQAFTREVDDIGLAVSELSAGIDRSLFMKNTCGIVFCGFEPDMNALVRELKKSFDFPFFGCTGIGVLSTNGYSQSSISLLVLTADDVEFSIGMTEEIKTSSDIRFFGETYHACRRELSYKGEFNSAKQSKGENPAGTGQAGNRKEKLIFTYVPWLSDITFDDIVSLLDEESGQVPIYGGIASDGWTFDSSYVFTDRGASQSRGVMMVLVGNVNPIFTIEHSTTLTTNLHKVVTKAEGTVVYELDGKPVTNFIRDMGLITDKTSVILDFLGTPFLATQKTKDGDEIDTLRCLGVIDHEKQACGYIGKIEEGSELNMVLISKEDIENSVKAAFDQILSQIEKSEDYQYSSIFCSSCAARYCLLVADKNAEGRAYEGRLPENVNVQGVYIYGEFCPAHGKHRGGLYNVLSNETFTILAM
ncbi:MAG: FIST C-terminal domain-containing protein [Lachnospiraceae bacterium]|nr:FIST C-terminal domain-containing protein [Lachnospiraceae bacterium]